MELFSTNCDVTRDKNKPAELLVTFSHGTKNLYERKTKMEATLLHIAILKKHSGVFIELTRFDGVIGKPHGTLLFDKHETISSFKGSMQ